MIVGIAALGLIGGSMAKIFSENGDTVLGYDVDKTIMDFAMINGTISGYLTKENIGQCDMVLVAAYPQACVEYIMEMGPYIGSRPIVMDLCGTKRNITQQLFPYVREHGIKYCSVHPMAGTHQSGFKYSRSNMFEGASLLIVPETFEDPEEISKIKEMFAPAKFGKFVVTTPEKHDKIISYTSHMTHLMSNAFIKSPTVFECVGFTGGSFRDMTRIAWLAPQMWGELFLENKDNLLSEIDIFVNEIEKYRKAIEEEDLDTLVQLLKEGREIKGSLEGK